MGATGRRVQLAVNTLEDRWTPSVFGFDNRVPVWTSQLHNPVTGQGAIQINPAIGQMFLDGNLNGRIDQGDQGYGTSFLIGQNYAMTAAHCVYTTDANGLAKFDLTGANSQRILIAFGSDGHTANVGIARVKRAIVPDGWRQLKGTGVKGNISSEATTHYDYALLELDQNIGTSAQA